MFKIDFFISSLFLYYFFILVTHFLLKGLLYSYFYLFLEATFYASVFRKIYFCKHSKGTSSRGVTSTSAVSYIVTTAFIHSAALVVKFSRTKLGESVNPDKSPSIREHKPRRLRANKIPPAAIIASPRYADTTQIRQEGLPVL